MYLEYYNTLCQPRDGVAEVITVTISMFIP